MQLIFVKYLRDSYENQEKVKKTKVLHNGESFTSKKTRPHGMLPTTRQILERIIDFRNCETTDAASNFEKEIYDR